MVSISIIFSCSIMCTHQDSNNFWRWPSTYCGLPSESQGPCSHIWTAECRSTTIHYGWRSSKCSGNEEKSEAFSVYLQGKYRFLATMETRLQNIVALIVMSIVLYFWEWDLMLISYGHMILSFFHSLSSPFWVSLKQDWHMALRFIYWNFSY